MPATRVKGRLPVRQLDFVGRLASLGLAITLSLLCSIALRAEEAAAPKKVLLLLAFESSRPVTTEVLRGLEDGLRKSYPTRVSVFVEFTRFAPPAKPDQPERLYQWIKYKYGDQKFDAICAAQADGLLLARQIQERLWPGVPVLFLMEKREYQPAAGPQTGVTGTVLNLGEEESVQAAISLLPGTRHVALVTGASAADRAVHEKIEGLIHRLSPSMDIIPLIGLSLRETVARVQGLPEDSIIYLVQFLHDSEGRQLTLPELAATLAPAAKGPMFNFTTLPFGSGVLGGPMVNIREGAEEWGHQVAQVLKGAPAGSVPVVSVQPASAMDWRELRRWKIPEERIPPGTEIRFRTYSGWEQYRTTILAAAGAIVLQAMLIGLLLLERYKRSVSDQAARSSDELSRAILSSLNSRIAVLDGNDTVIRLSDNWVGGQGYPPARLGGNYLGAWRTWGAGIEAKDEVTAAVEGIGKGRRGSQTVEYYVPEAAHERWVEVRVERLNRPHGGTVITHLDITQQRQAELDRRQSMEELHHMNRVAGVGELAGSLAHELAQPLASILANAQAALRFLHRPEPDFGEVREALAQIADDDRRAQGIINRIRTILKKQPVSARDVDLNQTVEEVIALIRGLLLTRNIQLRLVLAPQGVVVRADSIGLQQVLLNLLNNAMDAVGTMQGGRRSLVVSTSATGNFGEMIVEDNGPGIPAQRLERLFDSFHTTKADGPGMGLSICRSIVESLGGTVSAESRAGGGAVFKVSVPLAEHAGAPQLRRSAAGVN